MNSSVPCSTVGSGLGNGKSVVEDELASLMTSTAGNLANTAIALAVFGVTSAFAIPGVAGSGDDVAEAPLEERSGVLGVSAKRAGIFLDWGVYGDGGPLACGFSS